MKIPFTLTILLIAGTASAISPDSTFLVSPGVLGVDSKERLSQDIYYRLPLPGSIRLSRHRIQIDCYDLSPQGDSLLVYSATDSMEDKPGTELGHFHLDLSSKSRTGKITPLYKDILTRNQYLPAGRYYSCLTLKADTTVYRKDFFQTIDSLLPANAPTQQLLDQILKPEPKGLWKTLFKSTGTTRVAKTAQTLWARTGRRVERALEKKGMRSRYRETPAGIYVDIYYGSRFVGSSKIEAPDLTPQPTLQKDQLISSLGGNIDDDLKSGKSLFSQIKKLRQGHEPREVIGSLSILGNLSSGQEEYSESDNNYYEIAGQLQAPVLGIPVQLEGYYTSQDRNRTIKAGYFKIHYDTEQAKSELQKLIAGYRDQYERTTAKGKGLSSIYGAYLDRLKNEKDQYLSRLQTETGLSDISTEGLDTAALRNRLTRVYEEQSKSLTDQVQDSLEQSTGMLSRAQKTADSVKRLYDRAMRTYERLQDAQQKIAKYQKLLEQYETNRYFDSALVYDKIRAIEDGSADEQTYKELVQSAGELLPEGSVKKFMTGLTHLDAGILSTRLSGYTLDGQTMKGLDVGYDLGFCETGLTYGRVEYVSRDGSIDRYSGYSVRAALQPVKGHKATLIYYGYMPSRRMLTENDFFKDVDINMPAFKNPVHIFSLLYSGKFGKHVRYEAEGATSYRKARELEGSQGLHDRMSYRLEAEGSLPYTNIDLSGGYEHVGKNFENNSLPLNLSGTDRWHLRSSGHFFNNFLSLSVDYNVLHQHSLAVESSHAKWGFSVSTHSKRFPTLSLSYKPFSTYRSVADTFSIPQKPILGEVWLSRLSYRIKKKDYTLRLTALYNQNTSLMDTVESGSKVAQFNVLMTKGKANLMLNAGLMDAQATYLSAVHGPMKFLDLSGGYPVHPQWSLNLAQNFGWSAFGLCRYATTLGIGYRLKKTPLRLRYLLRYNTYKTTETNAWTPLLGSSMDLSWDFRFKMKDKKN